MSHQKHAKITKRNNGIYAPNEVSILGVKCGVISDLVNDLAKRLQGVAKTAYVDASHASDIEAPVLDVFTFHKSGNLETNVDFQLNKFNSRIQLSQYDLTFINGNHYPGNKQIIVLDPEKEASITKRIDEITDIKFFIKSTSDAVVFDVLKEKFSGIDSIPVYELDDIDGIFSEVQKLIEVPDIQSVILAGGLSSRMGTDKGLLEYHGKAQRTYMYELLQDIFPVVDEGQKGVYISTRQHQDVPGNTIVDKFKGLGPFGAICSAFQENPNTAWLVLATDLPFVDENLIRLLISKRNPAKVATAIKGKNKEFPEPLITIWEPKSYPILLSYLAQGYSCPRKILINADVELVEVDDSIIQNINTPEEFQQAKKDLNQ